ncbi:MAG: phosphatase PAP2 family protein [Alphaproteobacteria bacterium]|nr:phosphatase PAP2 family protein [Alphaproteobacteria bacterium]
MTNHKKTYQRLDLFSTRPFALFLLMILVALCLEQFRLDFDIQDYFYDKASHAWIIDGGHPIYRMLFYTGIKYTIGAVGGVVLLFMLSSWYTSRKFGGTQQRCLFFILCLLLIPSVIALLKEFTYVHCPSRLVDYGGPSAFRGLLSFKGISDLNDRGKCFPAGHASGGFALMSLYYVWDTKMYRRIGLALGLIMGWGMACYQMLKGAHFFSHSLMTMLLSGLMIASLHALLTRIFKHR